MEDFIFGTLSTNESRITHLTSYRGGVTHAHQRSPRDPLPDQAITLTSLSVHPILTTRDGFTGQTMEVTPMGKMGSLQTAMPRHWNRLISEWDTLLWGYIRRFRGVIPGQRGRTVVRYRVQRGEQCRGNIG